MLSPRGPVKNSGKMVTTLIRSGILFRARRKVVHETELVVDYNRSLRDIGPDDYFWAIRNQHAAARGLNIEHQSLGQLVKGGDLAQLGAGRADRSHADEIV